MSDGPPADTIVAPATAAGPGERAVVRLSGPEAWELAARLVDDAPTWRVGRVSHATWSPAPGAPVDVSVLAFAAPRSATGEDVVELHLPGWPALVTEVVARLVALGARSAAPGEFTARAVVHGRLAPDAALAVGALVGAGSADEARAAVEALTTPIAERLDALADALVEALALCEAHVDFEEAETEAIDVGQLRDGLVDAADAARRLAATSAATAPRDGVVDVLLLGPPNAGKTSLFLALCPGARAAVSSVPGTTRDLLEATVERAGRRFTVLDGPGLEADHPELDDLDRAAMEVFVAQCARAGVVVDVEDVTRSGRAERRAARAAVVAGRPRIVVANKRDLAPDAPLAGDERGVSAATGAGVEALWDAIAAASPVPAAPSIADARVAAAADEVTTLVDDALSRGDLGAALPLVALALRDALDAVESARGAGAPRRDVVDDVLARIYASFCVGK